MKKIFFVAIAATLLAAGCQKTEVLNQVVADGEPSMSYAPSMGKLTKVATNPSEAGLQTLQNQDFYLWAYYVDADPNRGAAANTIYDGMANIKVDYNEGAWSTNPVHFWPGTGKALKFFAVSANETISNGLFAKGNIVPDVTAPGADDYDEKTSNYEGLTINSFIVDPTQPTSDLMVADYIAVDQSVEDVPLNFRHALSKVQILFQNTKAAGTDINTQVWVQHVEVKKIKKSGKLVVAKEAGKGADDKPLKASTRFAWTPDTPDVFIAKYTAKPQVEGDVTTNYTETADASSYKANMKSTNSMKLPATYTPYDTWLVIPQDIKKEATPTEEAIDLQIEIVYVIGTRQFVAQFPLSTETLTAWAPNQFIKYNINLSPNMIGFEPSVEEWEPSKDGEGVEVNN